MIRHLIVTPFRRSFAEICEKYHLNKNDQQSVIWINSPDKLMGMGGKNNIILVHSDYIHFDQFMKWHQELTFIAKYKDIEVIWDAQIIEDEIKAYKNDSK